LEKVCASKTSLTDTEMNKPRKVEVTAIKTILIIVVSQLIPDRSTTKEAITAGTMAFRIPKIIAPEVLASIKRFRLIGASNSRSKDLLLRSKVIVTASMEVVPKSTAREYHE